MTHKPVPLIRVLTKIKGQTQHNMSKIPTQLHNNKVLLRHHCSVVSEAKIESPTYSEYFDLLIEGITRHS